MRYVDPAVHRGERREVHASQHQHHVQPVSQPLYVVTAISNSQRFYSRYRLYQRFAKMCEDAGAILYTIELALRDRHHEITDEAHPNHIQVRSPAELWHKENLLNLAIRQLPGDWNYVAWIDGDIEFTRPDWAVECVHQLQHYHMIQMWSHAQDLGPDPAVPNNMWKPIGRQFQSFMYSWATGVPREDAWGIGRQGGSYGGGMDGHLWHSGFAWAARRSAISDLGGLGDIAICGAGDHHMAAALVGQVGQTIHRDVHPSYREYWNQWQGRALRHINRNVGYMPGLILHQWHGKKSARGYTDRWQILTRNQYDWRRDIKYDVQGLMQFTGNKWKLRNDIRDYFLSRNEDSIDC